MGSGPLPSGIYDHARQWRWQVVPAGGINDDGQRPATIDIEVITSKQLMGTLVQQHHGVGVWVYLYVGHGELLSLARLWLPELHHHHVIDDLGDA